jgi:uncharacterized protein (TIGR02118 family)
MIKMIILCKRRAGLSREDFIWHWSNVHARLAREDQNFWSRVRGYVQNYCLPSAESAGAPAWDGVVELWFDSKEELDAAFAGEQTQQVLQADVANFCDMASIVSLLVDENVLMPRGGSGLSG